MVSIAVGTALLAALWLLIDEVDHKYKSNALGYEVVVGPKQGAPLNLVLNTVFNLGTSVGIVPMSVYRDLHDDPRTRRKYTVTCCVPQARGDNYRGFPIIGTTDEMFSKFSIRTIKNEVDGKIKKRRLPLSFGDGRPFAYSHKDFIAFAEAFAVAKREGKTVDAAGHDHDHDHADDHSGHDHSGHDHGPDDIHFQPHHEAVIGAEVARKLGLKVGSAIIPEHGIKSGPEAHVHTESACKVVGILARTGTPLDRSVYIPMGVFLSMDNHEAIQTEGGDADSIGLSAIIVETAGHRKGQSLRYDFQTRVDAQAVVSYFEVTQLLMIVGDINKVLDVVAWLVLVVAGVSILVALYNTMNERRREIAIMRSLGAHRLQIVLIILQEASLISFVGGIVGVLLCHGAVLGLSPWIAEKTGVLVSWTAFSLDELWLILGATVLGCAAGILPAIKGSMTEVADNLGPLS